MRRQSRRKAFAYRINSLLLFRQVNLLSSLQSSGAGSCFEEPVPSQKQQQGQGKLHGTEAAGSHEPAEQVSDTQPTYSPSVSRGTESLQTRKADDAAQHAQHAAVPNNPRDGLTSPAGFPTDGAHCLEMWRESCSCHLSQVSPILPC